MSDRQDIEPHARRGTLAKRDSLARTGPLFVLLIVMLLVYGLAVLSGATTNHGVLIIALVLLVAATYGVVAGTIKMIDLPPEDGDEEPGHGSAHGH